MNCRESQKLFDGYIDGELDLIRNLEVEQHLKECPLCAREKKNLLVLRSALADESLYFKPSTQFQKRLNAAIRTADKAERQETKANGSSWGFSKTWFSVAAVLIVVALITFTLVRVFSKPSADELLAQEVVASHVRSLMVNHLTDVPSSDQHTVKPWFNGKLDFSPPVEDLAAQDFALIGGRLDYINNKSVAALIYQRRQHLINLFIWQSLHATAMRYETATRQGYNFTHWNKGDMTFWLVSDLNKNELDEFARLIDK